MNPQTNILIVEDDKILANIYKIKFSKSGFNVTIAYDGDQAIGAVNKQIPNVILLDLLMPKKDGFEVLKELRANALWKDVPVVVASNLGQDEDIKRAMSMGADNYFIKSNVKIADVVDTVLKTIKTPST